MCDPKIDRKTVPTNVKISLQPLSLNYWPLISATISKQHECCLYFFLAKQNHKLSAASECCCRKCSSVAPHNTEMTSESFCFFKPLIALSFPFMLHFILKCKQPHSVMNLVFWGRFSTWRTRSASWVIEKTVVEVKEWGPYCSDLVIANIFQYEIKCLKLKENYGGRLAVIN